MGAQGEEAATRGRTAASLCLQEMAKPNRTYTCHQVSLPIGLGLKPKNTGRMPAVVEPGCTAVTTPEGRVAKARWVSPANFKHCIALDCVLSYRREVSHRQLWSVTEGLAGLDRPVTML